MLLIRNSLQLLRWLLLPLLLCPVLLMAQNSDILFQQAMEAYRSSNFGSAELIFRKLVERRDGYEEQAGYHLGLCLFRQNRLDAAIFEFNRFILTSRTQELAVQSRYYIAESLYLKRDFIKAIEEYKRFLSQGRIGDPSLRIQARSRIAQIYFDQGRYDEAVIEWKAALASAAGEEAVRINLRIADALYRSGNAEEALPYVESLSEYSGDPGLVADISLTLGRVYQETDRHRQALRLFSRIPERMATQPGYRAVYYHRGRSHYELKETERALSELNSYLSFGETAELYYDALFFKSLIIHKDDPDASRAGLFSVYERTAKRLVKRQAAEAIADLYIASGDHVAALPFLETALNMDETSSKDLQFKVAESYIFTKRFPDAQTILLRMSERLTFDPELDRVYFLLAVCGFSTRDTVRGASYMQKMEAANPFSAYRRELPFYQGLSEFDSGNFQKAQSFFQAYLSGGSSRLRFESQRYLFLASVRLKDLRTARTQIDQIMARYPEAAGVDRLVMEFITIFTLPAAQAESYRAFILRRHPRSQSAAEIHRERGRQEFERGDYRRAEQSYSQYLAVMGNDTDITIFHGKVVSLFRQEKYAELIQFMLNEKMQRYDEKISTDLIRLLAFSYARTGQGAKAYSTFSLIADRVDAVDDIHQLFLLAIAEKDASNADAYAARLAGTSRYPEAVLALGRFYASFGQPLKAREYFDRITGMDTPKPVAIEARKEVARILIDDGAASEARDLLIALPPERNDSLWNLLYARASIDTGRQQEAAAVILPDLKGIARTPGAEQLFTAIAQYLFESGEAEKLRTIANEMQSQKMAAAAELQIMAGLAFFEKRNYRLSQQLLSRQNLRDSGRATQALYTQGMLALHYQRNANAALAVFTDVMTRFPSSDQWVQRAGLESALILLSRGQREQAAKLLLDLSRNPRETGAQARAIYEQYFVR